MKGFLYNQNETMKMLGHHSSDINSEVWNIINASYDTADNQLTRFIMGMFKQGILFHFLMNIYTLGVIDGKRAERMKKKGKDEIHV